MSSYMRYSFQAINIANFNLVYSPAILKFLLEYWPGTELILVRYSLANNIISMFWYLIVYKFHIPYYTSRWSLYSWPNFGNSENANIVTEGTIYSINNFKMQS